MPAFDHGAVTIVACPDGAAPGAKHDHHHSNAKLHQACPYAAASALGGLANEPPLLAAVLIAGLALLLGRAFAFLDKQRDFERPHSRGPPIHA